MTVIHRHEGVDWPEAERCPICYYQRQIADLDRERHQARALAKKWRDIACTNTERGVDTACREWWLPWEHQP
jgi:hypothetical protein